ncbi:MAG: hypothetical protein PHR28_04005, partial [candidate division Zixibacteria bacterium]|nr:hypothetical protein [candidate division Zixibacteria bacterium]
MSKKRFRWMIVMATLAGVVLFPITIYAQDSLWAVHHGGRLNETGYACRMLTNGDYAMVGATFSQGAGDYDVYLVKLDSAGDIFWERTYGGIGADVGTDLQVTPDSGFIIAGYTASWGNGKRDICLIKTSSDGTMEWIKTFGGVSDEEAYSVQVTADSGFIVCGTTMSFGQGGDLYLIRTDRNGDTLWTRTYGGTAGESGAAVRVTSDGGFVAIGNTGSFGVGYSSIYLVRTDSNGDTLWTATYGGEHADLGYDVEPTNDNGFILSGATVPAGQNYYDAYLVKIDSTGMQEWEALYGDAYEERAYSVAPTVDGGYVLTGTTESNRGRKIDIYLVKIDPVGGIEWDTAYGGAESDYGRMVGVDGAGNFLMAGSTYSYSEGGSDLYLLKVKGSAATAVDWPDLPLPNNFALAQNYPNPFNAVTRIEFILAERSAYSLAIYNIL